MNPFTLLKELWRGKDMFRILMNAECAKFELHGKVLDIGSGKSAASYYRFLKFAPNAQVTALDLTPSTQGVHKIIDLEKDVLPYERESADAILLFNVLEHIYNHGFLLSEIGRVVKPGGIVIGAVPFLVGYHADPHDFWRYTSESLKNIFGSRGFKNVKVAVVGRGPFIAGFNQIDFLVPRFFKVLIVPGLLALDYVVRKLYKGNPEKFALGLFFSFTK